MVRIDTGLDAEHICSNFWKEDREPPERGKVTVHCARPMRRIMVDEYPFYICDHCDRDENWTPTT